ncbi:MAG: extracellular solute-binding protein [Ruminococcus sp.]|nr:extracellular solute-binding protein [Ruminococcus sp.]
MKKHILSAAMLMALSLTSCSNAVKNVENSAENSSGTSQIENSNKEDVVITIALAVEPEPGEFDEFNNADNGYRIEYVASHSLLDENGDPLMYTTEESKKQDFDLIQRIINEDDIDIVGAFSFNNPAYYEILKNKGAFVDLYEFMKDDPDVNPELMNKHVLELCENDGHLYGLPSSYNVQTMIGKKEYVGDKQNWTVDEFLEHWNAMPDNTTINRSRNAEDIYYTILRSNLTSYVDYAKAEVYFDSPDFRKLLEFCGSFESNYGEKSELDYNAPDFISVYAVTGFMSSLLGYGYSGTNELSVSHIKDGEYTLVGYPDSDGQGSYISTNGEYSICVHSSKEKQSAAWEYIRQFYTEEYQQDHVVQRYEQYIDGEKVVSFSPESGFLINNNARKTTAERICNGEYSNPTYENKGETFETPLPTMEDCELIENYVDTINRIDTELDRSLWEIVNEEIIAYLGGDQDIDTTIDLIQNRASLMVSERS